MTDETGLKRMTLTIDPATWTNETLHIWGLDLTRESLTELLAAAEECADRAERNARAKCWASTGATIYQQAFADDMAPVDRLRAAVARVRGE